MSASSRRAVNHANHITAADAIAIAVAAETRTASIDIIIARTDTEMDHARTNDDMDTRDTAIATTRTTKAAAGNVTAKDIVADHPDATRNVKRK